VLVPWSEHCGSPIVVPRLSDSRIVVLQRVLRRDHNRADAGPEHVRRIDTISRLVTALCSAAVLAACSALLGPSPTQAVNLGISNETTLTVTLVVNGAVIATFAPGTASSAISAPLPDLPWMVEARSPSGRVLTSLTVHAGDVTSTEGPDGMSSSRSDGARVDLSCGRLDIWAGMPMNGPAPGSGSPGDCVP
jgi:hypothetical protein